MLVGVCTSPVNHIYNIFHLTTLFFIVVVGIAIQCIRGARSSIGHASKALPSIDLITAEMDTHQLLALIPFILFYFYISNTSHV